MELFKPLSPVIPVFFLIALGFTFARWKKIGLASVTEIIRQLRSNREISSGPRASRLHRSSEHVHVRGDHPHCVLADHVTQGEKEKKPKNS